jgi:hypothetical protein
VSGNTPFKEERKTNGGRLISLDGRPVRRALRRIPPDVLDAWINDLEAGGWFE